MEQSPAAKALNDWCDAERGRAARVADAIGVSAATVNHWRRGVIRPRAENCIAIERHTDGAVRAVEWAPVVDDASVATDPHPSQAPEAVRGAA